MSLITVKRRVLEPSWLTYLWLIEKVVKQIKKDDFKPDFLVTISRGGLIPGEIISYRTNVPLAVMAIQSYNEGGKMAKIIFEREIARTTKFIEGNGYLIDELTETGDALEYGEVFLRDIFGNKIKELRKATIYHKVSSRIRPDVFAKELGYDSNGLIPWILKPSENDKNLLMRFFFNRTSWKMDEVNKTDIPVEYRTSDTAA